MLRPRRLLDAPHTAGEIVGTSCEVIGQLEKPLMLVEEYPRWVGRFQKSSDIKCDKVLK